MLQMPLKELGIDYPQAGEEIAAGAYSFRVTAPADAREVRISIDDGPWLVCRPTDGHWWLDCPNEPGMHIAVTRVIQADGSMLVSQPRFFRVRQED